MKKLITFGILIVLLTENAFAQTNLENQSNIYIGYDLGEMAFNKFQNFGGELGYKFKNGHFLSFVYLNVKLTEGHLSSGFAQAVDGENVSGHWVGYEGVYNMPLFKFKNPRRFIYGGLSGGYHSNNYTHKVVNDFVDHNSFTIGIALGYRESHVFNIKGLYYNFQIPIRYNFNTLEETTLGESTVKKQVFGQTISFFVGYEF